MKVKEEVTYTSNRLKKTICDWCGKESTYQDFECDRGGSYTPDRLELERKIYVGCSCDGSYGTSYRVDLCLECTDKLFELMKQNGIKIQEEEFDY